MKKLCLLLTCLFFILCHNAYSQYAFCPQDTPVMGGIPSGAFLYSTGIPINSGCQFCLPYNKYNCWLIPGNHNLSINVAGNEMPPFGSASIWLVNDCRYGLWDSCQQIGHPFAAPFHFFAELPTNSEVCVFWDSLTTDSVGILIKEDGPTKPLIDSVIIDFDTCGPLIPIDEPHQPESAYYYQESEIRQAGLSGKRPIPVKGSERIPNVGYIKAGRIYGGYGD